MNSSPRKSEVHPLLEVFDPRQYLVANLVGLDVQEGHHAEAW